LGLIVLGVRLEPYTSPRSPVFAALTRTGRPRCPVLLRLGLTMAPAAAATGLRRSHDRVGHMISERRVRRTPVRRCRLAPQMVGDRTADGGRRSVQCGTPQRPGGRHASTWHTRWT
jgi:hypothetical protein